MNRRQVFYSCIVLFLLLAVGAAFLLKKVGADTNTAIDTTPGLEETLTWSKSYFSMLGYLETSTSQNSSPCVMENGQMVCRDANNNVIADLGSQVAGRTNIELTSLDGRPQVLHVKTGKEFEVDISSQVENLIAGNKYQLSFWTKIKDRTCYDIKPLADQGLYNPSFTGTGSPYHVKDNYYNWCGRYDLLVRPLNGTSAPLGSRWSSTFPFWAGDGVYLKNADQDWFYNTYDFVATADAPDLSIVLKVFGFMGDFYLDGLKVTQISSVVFDEDMEVPVVHPDMNVQSASSSSFKSNAATFDFSSRYIKSAHNSDPNKVLSTLSFIDKATNLGTDFLEGLAITKTGRGFVIYENENVRISAAADSTAIIKLKNPVKIDLGGIKPAYSFYRNGLLYYRDGDSETKEYGNGIFFSPILSEGEMDRYSYHFLYKTPEGELRRASIENDQLGYITDKVTKDIYLVDNQYPKPASIGENNGYYVAQNPGNATLYPNLSTLVEINNASINALKFWTDDDLVDFSTENWQTTYDARAGDAFILSVFPPKDFDKYAFCTQRYEILRGTDSASGWDQNKQQYSALSNIVNNWNLWNYYFTISNVKFENETLRQQFSSSRNFFDLQWPKELNNSLPLLSDSAAIKSALNVKLFSYSSPAYFLNNDGGKYGTYLTNIVAQRAQEDYIDGTYADGYPHDNLITNLMLVRRMRADLGSKLYVQHQSGNTWFFSNRGSRQGPLKEPDGAKFSVPFLDAYADEIWTAEALPYSEGDQDIWLNNFTGYGISNTPTSMLMEDRPPYTPQEQALYQLANWGTTRIIYNWPDYYESTAKNKDTDEEISFNTTAYQKKLNETCLSTTCGNNVCDIGESSLTCPNDCAPKNNEVSILKEGGQYTISKNQPLANWIIDNEPLFNLHYNFDEDIAYDLSGNKLDANIGGANNLFPSPTKVDGRDVYSFNGSTRLSGYHGSRLNNENPANVPLLDLNGKNFSIFANVKSLTSNEFGQVIYSQGGTKKTVNGSTFDFDQLVFGIHQADRKLMLGYGDGARQDGKSSFIYSQTAVSSDWNFVGITYDYATKTLRFYLNGQLDKEYPNVVFSTFGDATYNIGAKQNDYTVKWYLNGYLDDLFVSTVLLSGSQVESFNQNGLKGLHWDSQAKVKAILAQGKKKYVSAGGNFVVSSDKNLVGSGGLLTYRVQFNNDQGIDLHNMKLSIPIPAETSLVTGSITNDGYVVGGNIEWSINSLASDGLFQAEFKVRAN